MFARSLLCRAEGSVRSLLAWPDPHRATGPERVVSPNSARGWLIDWLAGRMSNAPLSHCPHPPHEKTVFYDPSPLGMFFFVTSFYFVYFVVPKRRERWLLVNPLSSAHLLANGPHPNISPPPDWLTDWLISGWLMWVWRGGAMATMWLMNRSIDSFYGRGDTRAPPNLFGRHR